MGVEPFQRLSVAPVSNTVVQMKMTGRFTFTCGAHFNLITRRLVCDKRAGAFTLHSAAVKPLLTKSDKVIKHNKMWKTQYSAVKNDSSIFVSHTKLFQNFHKSNTSRTK